MYDFNTKVMNVMFRRLLLIVTGVFLINTNAFAMSDDEGQIHSNVNSFYSFLDHGAFEHLSRLLAPQLTADFTSLFGGEVQQVNREDLITQWANFLPGFDTTFHNPSNVTVAIDGDHAKVSTYVVGRHWLGKDGFWAASAKSYFTLKRTDNNWEITSIKVRRIDEEGDRTILDEAPKRVVAN